MKPPFRRLCAGCGHGGLRVLRGGSWNNNRNNARCSYRNRNNPNNRNDNIGFRVVVSHNSQFRWPEMPPGSGRAAEATRDGVAGSRAEPRVA
jgi:hypothetical protein